MATIQQDEVRVVRVSQPEVGPENTPTYSTTVQPLDPEATAVVWRVFADMQSIASDLGHAAAWAAGSSTTVRAFMGIGPIERRAMIEGYRAFADDDLALAEADLAAGFEVLPPE